MWEAICSLLSDKLSAKIEYKSHQSASGGCIHKSATLITNAGPFFVKVNQAQQMPLLEAEAESLEAIHNTHTIACPRPIYYGLVENQATLVMQHLELAPAQAGSMQELGTLLAAMHQKEHKAFGWHSNNFIGYTPQLNAYKGDWLEFYLQYRLEPQIRWAKQKGLELSGIDELLNQLPKLFDNHTPYPALLHGDLWGGNIGFGLSGEPYIFDPACYYGDREADIAFTEMFGGFTKDFYLAYEKQLPLSEGYESRKRLYNLYHELNHYNLFGGGYGQQAQGSIHHLLNFL